MPTRYLKPGICDSSAIDLASPLAECLYYRLLVNVDDFGRLDARPAVIRSKCFPLKDTISNADTEKLLQELDACGLIFLYEVDGCVYIQFAKWDNVARAKVSKCPAPVYNPRTNVCNSRTVLPVTVTGTGTETVTDIPEPEPEPEPKPQTGTETKDLSAHSAPTAKRGTALSADWFLPKEWGQWALAEKPSWTADDVRRVADDFKDHWLANANQAKAKKADWLATWRKWVRSPLNEIKKQRGVQDARLDTADQIFRRGKYGNDGQVTDFDGIRSVESGGARIPETLDGVWKSDAGEVERDGDDGRLSGLGGSDAGFDA